MTVPESVKREHAEKLVRLRAWLSEIGADACALTLQSNFSWITGGRENRVYSAMEGGAATVVVTASAALLVANNIEMPRLLAEEVDGLNLTPVEFFWEDPAAQKQALAGLGAAHLVADTALPGAEVRTSDIARLRYSLTADEIDRYRLVGLDAATALEDAARAIQPAMTEHEISAEIAHRAMSLGVQPGLVLVAVDDRAYRFRHPLPTSTQMQKHAMLVLCGRRGGLIASVTRMVHFGQTNAELAAKHAAVCETDAAFISATAVGAQVRDVFAAGLKAHADHGFPDEWRLHHQGGATGYGSREFKGTHTTTEEVLNNQPYAWNPSIAGTKSEDTILSTAEGPLVLTGTGNWPMRETASIPRPDMLIR